MSENTSPSVNEPVVEVPCPLCGHDRVEEVWRHVSGIANGVCTRCGHVYLFRRFPSAAIEESYSEYGQQYPESHLLDQDSQLFQVARRRFAYLQRHLPEFPPSSLLEVGSGYGHFLSLFQGSSRCVGIEPSTEQAAFAAMKLGVREVIRGGYESSESHPLLQAGGFDLVCSFHVLEHLLNPAHFLEFTRRFLKPEGHLCLAVPDLQSLNPDLIELYFMTRCWHLHTFSRASMSRLLENYGFTVQVAEQEGATPMLRSSTVYLARRDDSVRGVPYSREVFEQSREAALRFHRELDRRLAVIRDTMSAWRDQGLRVMVYGGGIHTRALLSLVGVVDDAVTGIIDDDPNKAHTLVCGVPVMSLEEAQTKGIDVIIVSSLASEDDMISRLEGSGIASEVVVKGVYRDLCRSN